MMAGENQAQTPILFVFHAAHALTALEPLIQKLRGSCRLHGVTFDLIPADELARLEQRLGFPIQQVKAAASPRWLPAPLQRLYALFQRDKVVKTLLNRLHPAWIVFTTDHAPFEARLAHHANQRGSMTLLIQWALTLPQASYDELFNRNVQPPSNPLWKFRRRMSLALRQTLGLVDVQARTLGGGPARYFAVMGEGFVDQFVNQGVPREKIIVTGAPAFDTLFQTISQLNRDAARRTLADAVRLPTVDAPIVLFATQPMAHFDVMDAASYRAYLQSVTEAALRLPEIQLIFKLHPRESEADYAFVRSERVHVIRDIDLNTAVAACDVFISQFSSTILNAMAFEKPIISLNFTDKAAADYFATLGGTLHIKQPDAFADALRRALSDVAVRQTLAAQQKDIVRRFLYLDGAASQRLAALIATPKESL